MDYVVFFRNPFVYSHFFKRVTELMSEFPDPPFAVKNALRTLSFFTAVPFRGYVLRECQLIALSNNRSVDVKECDELTRTVRNTEKEQQ